MGLGEGAAKARYGRIAVLRYPFFETDRAQIEGETAGLVKLVALRNGRILGASILGSGADELIALFQLALKARLTLSALAGLAVPYPTLAEAAKGAAASFYAPRLFGDFTRRLVRLLARLGSVLI